MLLLRKSGLRYVPRTGIVGFDFQIGDFTQDGTWRTKSIAAIVPVRAKMVAMKVLYSAAGVGRFFGIRHTGATYAYDNHGSVTLVAAAQHEWNVLMPMTAAGTFEYNLPVAGSTMANIIVQGWWL